MNIGIEDAAILAALMAKDKLELYHDLRYLQIYYLIYNFYQKGIMY